VPRAACVLPAKRLGLANRRDASVPLGSNLNTLALA
jgi:hypothetical protein